jgi:formiminotetrahydrofolate cyclodeaminase
MKEVLEESETLRGELKDAVDRDAKAFTQVMDAYKLPKSDPDRKEAIQDATLGAALVPLKVAEKSLRVMGLALEAAQSGNINAISDAASAVNLAYASLKSAAYNVRINLSGLDDKKEAGKMRKAVEGIEKQAGKPRDSIEEILKDRGDIF